MSHNNKGIIPESYFDNLIPEENKNIGFDLKLVKRKELYVNLIYFDLNMRNHENYRYYNDFKVDVVGGFLGMNNFQMLEKYLEAIINKNIPFIVISSGSSGANAIKICKKFSFVKEVIIFCGDYKKHEHYIKDNQGYVKNVFTSIDDVYNYIQKFKPNKYEQGIKDFKNLDKFYFSYEDIKMNKQLEQCPVISAYEYDRCYFLVHRAYAYFFGDINNKNENVIFKKSYFKIVKDYINKSEIIKSLNKNVLIFMLEDLVDKKNFVELTLRKYTVENGFCYIFNKAMRNFESGLMSLAYFMGPFLFGLNKYVKENPNKFCFNNDMVLYRNIRCSIYDFYLYEMNKNHIICFPSITSTSTVRGKFNPTPNSQTYNNTGIKKEDMLNVTMIFNYTHKYGNISPGIIIKDNMGKDGNYISSHYYENEVILFPFTFAKIKNINKIDIKTYEIYLDIINRNNYIEYTLKNNVEKRIRFGDFD